MNLETVTIINRHGIVSAIGKGGIGEVYPAEDSRFGQAAKATSALNRPNSLTVYDIGEHDGAAFPVAELSEGTELRLAGRSNTRAGSRAGSRRVRRTSLASR